jgi:preprotein translocase subunit SecG
MLIVFGALIIVSSIILGLIVLIQNPKGGGLASSFGGFGNQLMGVKQTTDILEKGTWLFAAIIGILCLTSSLFIPKTTGSLKDNQLMEAPATSPAQQQNTMPLNNTTQPPVTPQK